MCTNTLTKPFQLYFFALQLIISTQKTTNPTEISGVTLYHNLSDHMVDLKGIISYYNKHCTQNPSLHANSILLVSLSHLNFDSASYFSPISKRFLGKKCSESQISIYNHFNANKNIPSFSAIIILFPVV